MLGGRHGLRRQRDVGLSGRTMRRWASVIVPDRSSGSSCKATRNSRPDRKPSLLERMPGERSRPRDEFCPLTAAVVVKDLHRGFDGGW